MSGYSFIVNGTITLNVDVEAATLEEAIELARSASTIGLCHQCARGSEGEWSTSGELDCDPAESPLVDLYVDGDEPSPEVMAEAKRQWT